MDATLDTIKNSSNLQEASFAVRWGGSTRCPGVVRPAAPGWFDPLPRGGSTRCPGVVRPGAPGWFDPVPRGVELIVFMCLSWSRFNLGLIMFLIIWGIVSQGLVRGQEHLKAISHRAGICR